MFQVFEKLVSTYPAEVPAVPPKSLWSFLWSCTKGLRPYMAAVTVTAGVIGLIEALLFAMMGKLVDWLAKTEPAQLWDKHAGGLILLFSLLAISPIMVSAFAFVKHQTIMGNFPMRLRWNFHRMMLGQSMSFYQNEFAGRVATKVMQTALAVRDVWMILADVMVFVIIYFVTMVIGAGGFDWRIALPFIAWVIAYGGACWYFVPRLAKISQAQADARSLMTGRITDAYTNIATVKLFSHAQREAGYAKNAMQEFMSTVYKQWRYITAYDMAHHVLIILLTMSTVGVTIWLWSDGAVGVGAVAAATAMTLRLNGMSNWIMWELAGLFEHIGTVRDGLDTLSKQQTVVDAPTAKPLTVTRGEIRFENVTFSYAQDRREKSAGDATTEVARPQTLKPIFENLSLTTHRQVMDTNYFGALNTVQAALPHLKRSRKARIINIASIAGLTGVFGYSAYCASKHALVGLSEVLRYELAPQGITVQLVCPPEFDSPMVDALDRTRTPENREHTLTIPKVSVDAIVNDVMRAFNGRDFLVVPGRLAHLSAIGLRHFPAVSRLIGDLRIRKAYVGPNTDPI